MILQNFGDMSNPRRYEADERTSLTSGDRRNPCCSTCCMNFWLAFTFTGFLTFLAVPGLLLFINQGTTLEVCFFFLCSLICLAVFVSLFCRTDVRRPRYRVSREPSIDEIYLYFVSKTQSDGALINIPGRAESTRSLPCYVLLNSVPGQMVEKFTESTVSEECRETLDEEAAGSSKEKGSVTPLAGGELGEATETIVKIVDETLYGKGGAEAASEGSSGLSAETQKVVQPGVRQRKQTPMESQTYVPEPEGEKTE